MEGQQLEQGDGGVGRVPVGERGVALRREVQQHPAEAREVLGRAVEQRLGPARVGRAGAGGAAVQVGGAGGHEGEADPAQHRVEVRDGQLQLVPAEVAGLVGAHQQGPRIGDGDGQHPDAADPLAALDQHLVGAADQLPGVRAGGQVAQQAEGEPAVVGGVHLDVVDAVAPVLLDQEFGPAPGERVGRQDRLGHAGTTTWTTPAPRSTRRR